MGTRLCMQDSLVKALIGVVQHYLRKLSVQITVCKCFRTALEKLVADNPSYKGKGKLTKLACIRMTGAMRAAIKVHSLSHKAGNENAALDLKKEMLNIPFHVFGYHTKYSSRFCKVVQGKLRVDEVQPKDCDHDNCETYSKSEHDCLGSDNTIYYKGLDTDGCEHQTQTLNADSYSNSDSTSTANTFDESSYISDILGDQAQFWKEGMGDEDLLKARGECLDEKMEIDSKMYVAIYQIVLRYANKAESLLDNETTILAEMWMNIRSKFDGGKQINGVQKSSWNTRCIVASLRFQFGPDKSPIVWKIIFLEDANPVFQKTYSIRLKAHQIAAKYAKSAKGLLARRKRKQKGMKSSGEGKQFYGTDSVQVENDLTPSELAVVKEQFYQTHVVVTKEEAIAIEIKTRKQNNDDWRENRRIRLTSTTTAAVRKRQQKTALVPLVKDHLYPKAFSNKHTEYTSHCREVWPFDSPVQAVFGC